MEKRSLFIILCLFSLVCVFCSIDRFAQANDQADVYFSPAGGAQKAIIEKLDAAGSRVDVAMYILTNRELGEALISATRRGVKVRVVLDGSHDEEPSSLGRYLSENSVEIRVDRSHMLSPGANQGLMHNKFAVIDSGTVITGSYNWTASAESRNDENLLIITDAPDLAEQYRAQFETIWTRSVSYDIKKLPAPIIIDAHDSETLRNYSGQEAYVQGQVHDVRFSESGSACFLDFGPDRLSFTAVIYKKAVRKLAELKITPKKYEGKRIEVYGRIVNHPRYGLEIIIDDPVQIRIMKGK